MPGNKAYTVEYLATVIQYDIPQLPTVVKAIIKKAIEERLMVDSISFGKPMRYSLKGHRRLRVGDYRIIYCVDVEQQLVIVIAIKHRKIVYEDV